MGVERAEGSHLGGGRVMLGDSVGAADFRSLVRFDHRGETDGLSWDTFLRAKPAASVARISAGWKPDQAVRKMSIANGQVVITGFVPPHLAQTPQQTGVTAPRNFMPIKVTCKCGQSFTAKDDLVGQTLLCPKCHQPLTIAEKSQAAESPSAGGIASLFEEAGFQEVRGPRCPQCGAALPQDVVLCVACGFNRETGETHSAAEVRAADEGGFVAAAESMMSRAVKQIEYDKQETKKTQTQGAPIWLLLSSLVILISFAATMYLLPRDQAFWMTGIAVISLAGFVQFICAIRILIIAFMERLLHGLLCLFIPPYMLFYVFTRWATCGTFALGSISAGIAQLVGYGMVSVSPMLKPDELGYPVMPTRAVVAQVRLEDYRLFNQEGKSQR